MSHILLPDFVRLGSDDIHDLAQLEQDSFSLPWSEKELTAALTQASFAAFGLRESHHETTHKPLVAYISIYHTVDEVEILNIAVRRDRRCQGYGRHLLGLVLRIAEKMGILRAVLEVRVSNAPALHLYEQFHFVRAGLRRGYYPDTGEDALIYTLSLPSESLPSETAHPLSQESSNA